MPSASAYLPRRPASSRYIAVRGLRYHVWTWGEPALVTPQRPPLVMAHGWMDVGASFQFVVDALADDRYVVAPDWRGYGLTATPGVDGFWFADYLGDLDALIDAVLAPSAGAQAVSGVDAVDLLGHSMGGNVAMLYAGVRPRRVRRLVNLEGFGLPAAEAEQAPGRYAEWLDQLKAPSALRDYASLDDVARRLMSNNPLLTPDKAAWLAPHWAQRAADGRWHILGHPAHKQPSPLLYRTDEVLAVWRRIAAPVLWLEGDRTDVAKWWGKRYTRDEFEARLAVVPGPIERARLSPCGHMLHHDQPEAVAAHLTRFLS